MSYEELSQVFTVKWDFTHDGDQIGCEGSTFEVHFRGDYVRHDVDTDMGNKEEYEVEISAEWVEQISGANRFRLQDDHTPIKENTDFLLDYFRNHAIELMEEEANS
tara:strand:+ start:1000 stop:1317 length:318 start_codon:yes stop_codon:yes gene_type:complete